MRSSYTPTVILWEAYYALGDALARHVKRDNRRRRRKENVGELADDPRQLLFRQRGFWAEAALSQYLGALWVPCDNFHAADVIDPHDGMEYEVRSTDATGPLRVRQVDFENPRRQVRRFVHVPMIGERLFRITGWCTTPEASRFGTRRTDKTGKWRYEIPQLAIPHSIRFVHDCMYSEPFLLDPRDTRQRSGTWLPDNLCPAAWREVFEWMKERRFTE